MIALALAAAVFALVVGLTVGLWWISANRREITMRLTGAGATDGDVAILHARVGEKGRVGAMLGKTAAYEWLSGLIQQSGRGGTVSDVLMIMATFGLIGGIGGWLRGSGAFFTLLCMAGPAALPLVFLSYKRQQRLKRFERQFPDGLDMLSRAIRSGYALAGGIQLVGDEMPDPVGEELRKVFEEIRLGLEPGEALGKLASRIPGEDVRFFCTAIRIQRTAGGNLAEMLDRLSEVIRERFKLLGHARALSAQQRYAALTVGLSPLVFAAIFRLMNPNYFDPLLNSPLGPTLITAGAISELIGFVVIWRIARIKI
jgi:tight adherence protein B